MANYKNSSPYYATPITVGGYLDFMTFRSIDSEDDDILYEVDARYQYRPDLLSFDTYDTVDYWWVFAVRNKSILKDPVFDLVAGMKIYLPKINTIKKALGV